MVRTMYATDTSRMVDEVRESTLPNQKNIDPIPLSNENTTNTVLNKNMVNP